MTTMPLTVSRLAEQLHMPVEGLVQRSLRAYLLQQIRATQMDIADFQDRYRVNTSAALRHTIELGQIYSHPAWEDAIEWETLENHLAHLETLLPEAEDV
jgi:hypothetical protein